MTKLSKTRVLIVEDEPDIAGLMKHALERGGDMDVEIVATGRRGAESRSWKIRRGSSCST